MRHEQPSISGRATRVTYALALGLALAACVPDTGGFVIGDEDGGQDAAHRDAGRNDGDDGGRDGGRDAAGGDAGDRDAAALDAGPPDAALDCTRTLLGCATACEALLNSVAAKSDFEGEATDIAWLLDSGSAELMDGHLVMHGPHTYLLSTGSFSFGATAMCAEVEVTFGDPGTDSSFWIGFLGNELGMLSGLSGTTQALRVEVYEPIGAVLDQDTLPVAIDGSAERYTLFWYLSTSYAHAEARRASDGSTAVVHGPYAGDTGPLYPQLRLHGTASGVARVDRVAIGRPNAATMSRLDAW